MYTVLVTTFFLVSFMMQPIIVDEEGKQATHHSFASSSLPMDEKKVPAFALEDPLELKVILKTYDEDRLVEREESVEKIWAMEDFWAEYDGWVVEDQKIGEIVFQKKLEKI
ncbi:BofC N-terminal domain-containing protein [Halobacillus seohaensis]|uniref:BofC N-terminal domain-containing protein n=1 Tax=Halobacillus seohaensis TaxID=447421 RepID=A0ABW2EGX7_9BACI